MKTEQEIDELILRLLGELVSSISEKKIYCLRELLTHVKKVSSPISLDFAVYKPPSITGFYNSSSHGKWYSVFEQDLPIDCQYPNPDKPEPKGKNSIHAEQKRSNY
jgi:hypothetical protein